MADGRAFLRNDTPPAIPGHRAGGVTRPRPAHPANRRDTVSKE